MLIFLPIVLLILFHYIIKVFAKTQQSKYFKIYKTNLSNFINNELLPIINDENLKITNNLKNQIDNSLSDIEFVGKKYLLHDSKVNNYFSPPILNDPNLRVEFLNPFLSQLFDSWAKDDYFDNSESKQLENISNLLGIDMKLIFNEKFIELEKNTKLINDANKLKEIYGDFAVPIENFITDRKIGIHVGMHREIIQFMLENPGYKEVIKKGKKNIERHYYSSYVNRLGNTKYRYQIDFDDDNIISYKYL